MKNTNLSGFKQADFNPDDKTVIGIVVSEWNEEITGSMCAAAKGTLLAGGISPESIVIRKVPGSFELALGAKWMLEYSGVDAVICIGCVIQGETRHFEFICQAVATGIANLSLDFSLPVIFGVLTTNTYEQALERAGGSHGNKGTEAAVAALKMLGLKKDLYKKVR